MSSPESKGSAWDQSRYKPWSTLSDQAKSMEASGWSSSDQGGSTAIENVNTDSMLSQNAPIGGKDASIKSSLGVDFEWMDLFRQVAFGGTVGSFTGIMFGFMDGMKEVQDSKLLKNASNSAKLKFLAQGSSRSGLVFGAFFGGFQAVKYSSKVFLDPGNVGEIAIASVASIGALSYKPTTRSALPYGAMLICMDCISAYMRENP